MVQVTSLFGLLSLKDEMTPALNSAMGNARSFGSNIGGAITGNVRKLGTAMAGAAVIGVTAFAGMAASGVNEFATLQRGMNEVFTLMPGITQSAMDDMTWQTNHFAERFGTLPNEVVPALYQSLSAGVPSDNVFSFLETAQMAATGGVTELETAVDGISSVINAYGQDVLSATDASDLMFTAVRLGKTDFGQLSSSLFNVIPTASSLGIGFDNVTAGLAAITAQGVPTSVATTQMRQLFIELGDSTKGVGQTFSQVSGSSFQDFIAGGGDVSSALQLMYSHAGDTGLNIDQLFGSVEAGAAALALTGQGAERFSSFLGEMQNASGATEGAYSTMNSGISRSMDFLNSTFSVFLSNFGSLLAPAIEPAINILTTFFRIINAGLDSGETMSDWLTHLPVPLRGVGRAVGSVSAWFYNFGQQLSVFFSNLSVGMGPVDAFSLMLWNLGIPGELMTGIGNLVTGIQNLITPIASFIQQNVQMSDVLTAVGIAIGAVVIPAVFAMVAPIVGTFALLVGAVALVRHAWENNFGGIQEKVGAFTTWFTDTAMPAVTSFITDTLIPGFLSFITTVSGIWDTVSPTLTSLYDWFMTTGLPMIGDFISTTIIPGITTLATTIFDIWNTISPTLTSIYDWFMTTGLPAIGDYISGPFSVFITGVTDLFSGIWDVISPGLTLFKDGVETVFSYIMDNAITPVSNALSLVWDAFSSFTTWSGNALSSAGNFLSNLNPLGGGNQVDGARASGGPVTSGRSYLVGEEGPELFTPSSSGNVSSNSQTAAMAGAGGETFVFNGDIITPDPEDFMRQLQERRRRRQ